MRTIIFKAIEKCNASCVYCDVIKKKQNVIMDFELLELIFKKINEFLQKYPEEEIEFLWHGGEVALLGARYFETAKIIQDKQCPKTKERIKHATQSNITAINQEIIDSLKALGIRSLGTSYDMIQGVRGLGPQTDTTAYNSKFLKNIELLRKNNIACGIIYVVHKKSLKKAVEIYHHLSNIVYDGSVKFNMIHIYGEDKYGLRITEEEFAHFVGQTFNEWWKYRYTTAQGTSFRDYFYALTKGEFTSSCINTGNCAYRWCYIDPTGKAAHCSEGGDYGYPYYGNIQENSFEEIFAHNDREKLLNRNYVLPKNECEDCRFWGVCRGGCPWAAYNKNDNLNSKIGCTYKKILLSEYIEPAIGKKFALKPYNLITE